MSAAASDSILGRNLRRFRRDRASLAWGVVFALFLLAAIFAPLLAPHDPAAGSLLRRLQPPGWMEDGEWAYPLGCDALGRDILSRLLHGARVSISIGVVVALVASCFGTTLGLLAGLAGGVVDAVISRIVDVLFAFPLLIFAIGLMGMMGPGLLNIILALVLKDWVITCRLVRGQTLDVRDKEYVEAAVAVGASRWHVMTREILPNILSPVIVVATIRMATIIMTEASLSFLGIGVQPPTPAWGSMIADGRGFMMDAWWVSTFPGLAIFLLVLSVNLTSQGLRDAFDPRLAR
ncbi:ABC transporter permease [Falsiroseomonas sp. HW251]|uniref:ABC transporter permease n=1 Tax=Falsiroseomonas sp. HW251 TaxID=3390998 RepID=UPI003D320CAA